MGQGSSGKLRRKLLLGLAVGLGAGVLSLGADFLGAFGRWENTVWAWRVKSFARPSSSSAKIRLILLDQKSLDWGKEVNGWAWPWPREVYGVLAGFLARAGARTVAFDVLYTEPSFWGVSDDEAFCRALDGPVPFVGALALSREAIGESRFPPGLPGIPLRGKGLADLGAFPALDWEGLTLPLPELMAASRNLANVTDRSDSDAVFRRVGLVGMLNGEAAPSLGLGAWLAGMGGEVDYRDGVLLVGNNRIPLGPDGRSILNYRGPLPVYQPVSAASVIRSEVLLQGGEKPELDPDFFRDCFVLFGFSAPGLKDLRATPISPMAPGVLVHATVLDNLLENDFIRPLPPAAAAVWILLVSLLGGMAMILCRKASTSVLVALVVLPLPWLLGFGLYRLLWWWPVVAPAAGSILALAGAMIVNYATEGRQKAYIKNAFRHYLSPAVIERLLADPSQLLLGGVRRELSIFFSDLQGFSSFSERLSPSELTALLNDYLTDMTEIILEEGGTLDKYEGDAIIAFWNAPLDQPDHARRAVRTAVRCQRRLAARRRQFEESYGVTLLMRIGINTGEVVVGNMGSRERFDYTVLGDAANLASRLEGANKAFGTYTMVSAATWEGAGSDFPGRELGAIRVVGKAVPVRVFEPLGEEGDEVPPAAESFARGLAACREGNWEKAAGIFGGLSEDPAAAVYLRRVGELAGQGPEAWDGIWNLSSK